MTVRTLAVPFAALAIAAVPTAVVAGPVDPPPGPIQSTQKSLDDVEPRTPLTAEFVSGNSTSVFNITAPGHYYLTEDLLVPASQNGIVVSASNVVIDLNGYTIRGLANSFDAITTAGSRSNIVIRNGYLLSVLVGIRLQSSSSDVVIEDVNILNSGDDGIQGGLDVVVRRCDIVSQGDGVDMIGRGRVEDSFINVEDDGVRGGNGVLVRNNTIRAAIDGSGDGVEIGFEGVVEGNQIVVNNGRGIRAVLSRIADNTVEGDGTGIDASGLTSGNTVRGFSTGIQQSGGSVVGNSVFSTIGTAIEANNARVEGNTINIDVATGIQPGGNTTVVGNSITGDDDGGTVGIQVAGTFVVIEENAFASLDVGVSCTANRRAFIRGNTAIDVGDAFGSVTATGNVLGPVETLTGASTTIASTSPHTNFDYQ